MTRVLNKHASVLLVLVMLLTVSVPFFSIGADAASGQCGDGVLWSFDEKTGELTISGNGNMTEYALVSQIPWYSFGNDIKSVTVGDGVGSICGWAFSRCKNLRSVKLGAGIKSIGEYAFSYCSALNSITIPEEVLSIGNRAFTACVNLVEVINKSALNIKEASSACGYVAYYALTVHSEKQSKLFERDGFVFYTVENSSPTLTYLVGCADEQSTLTLPTLEGGYVINKYAFQERVGIERIAIPEGVTAIGTGAFYSCTSLRSISVPKSITEIGANAFDNCSTVSDVYYAGTVMEWSTLTSNSQTDGFAQGFALHAEHTHTYGEWVVDREPTIYAEGIRHRNCKDCSYTEEETVARLTAADTNTGADTNAQTLPNKVTYSFASADVNITFVIIAFVGAFVSIGVAMFTKTKD